MLEEGILFIHCPCLSYTRIPAGLGHSKEAAAPAPIGELAPGSFLAAVVDALELGPPVVISPSLSGMYALPFLVAPGSQLRGYVPVAPICTDKISAADYASVKVSCVCVCLKLRWHVRSKWEPSLGLPHLVAG